LSLSLSLFRGSFRGQHIGSSPALSKKKEVKKRREGIDGD
jgi:hypothetical protein